MPSFILTCAVCPKTFEASRPNARTCSAACRQALHRRRRGEREAEAAARLDELLTRLTDLAIPKEDNPS